MVTTVDVYKEIRRLQLEGVTSQRQVTKTLGISRNTVKKYWNGDSVPWKKKEYNRSPTVLTSEVQKFIASCLNEDEAEGIKKQRHTARRIHTRLVDECGFTGSESAVRNAVHEMHLERKASEVFIPLRFQPGDSVQVDWGEATVYLNGKKVTVNLFCARMCHSCAPFVTAYWRQNLESFLDAIIRTFKYFGGVPRRIVFDNARVAVKSGFGAHAAAQDDYSQLAAHYGFEPVFCNPASGNEKGLVENLVGYIRRNVCVPLPRVASLEELNGKLLEQCVKYLEHKVEGRPQKVATMLEEDQQALYPLPKYPLDVSKKAYPTVGRYSTVLFETNQYSVPCKYRGKSTLLKAYPNTIEVWVNGELVAFHNRCQGKKQESLDLQHYLPILAQKGRAIRYARPVRNAVPLEFIGWMDSQHLKPKEMVELLEQCLSDGYQTVMQRKISEPSELDFSNEVNVQFVDLGQYDRLCSREVSVS
ncbi:MAG: IS21 family transposase [Clostridiales bacterium]|nr:IS21 family transposase [Clostridiales bacterium]